MTPAELRERIVRGEGPHTDFQRAVDRTADLAKDLVCFANSDGGQLIIGVADDRGVVGVADVDALLLRVDDVAFNLCAPPVTVVPETVRLDGHDIVVLNIPKGDRRPYSTRTSTPGSLTRSSPPAPAPGSAGSRGCCARTVAGNSASGSAMLRSH